MNANRLNDHEFKIIQDKDFLLTKANALSKIESMLSVTQKELKHYLSESALTFPDKSTFNKCKISRGENYLGLPYLVLDYPAIFLKENIFAFRTMFWWGHFFSTTLHLEGQFLSHYRNTLINNLNRLLNLNIYIGVGDTPWEYHYEKNNYELLTKDHKKYIKKCPFLKISKKFDLRGWDSLPKSAVDYFKLLLVILTT